MLIDPLQGIRDKDVAIAPGHAEPEKNHFSQFILRKNLEGRSDHYPRQKSFLHPELVPKFQLSRQDDLQELRVIRLKIVELADYLKLLAPHQLGFVNDDDRAFPLRVHFYQMPLKGLHLCKETPLRIKPEL